uniref:DUF6570 domain-containing protein n=1 Tax=Romanomermis culicivorax TaxID=13658 RepID=A0A915HM04_ROMCU
MKKKKKKKKMKQKKKKQYHQVKWTTTLLKNLEICGHCLTKNVIHNFPKESCHICHMWIKDKQGHTYKDWKKIPGRQLKNSMEIIKDLEGTCTLPMKIGNRCIDDFKANRAPRLSKYNNVSIDSVPMEISSLSIFEFMIIKFAQTFQTVIKLQPLTKNNQFDDYMSALKEVTVHLPLPLESMHEYVQDTLPSMKNLPNYG